MTATALLTELQTLGVIVAAAPDGHLELDAPRGLVTPETLDALRRFKAEIITLLQAGDSGAREADVELLYVLQERAAIMEFEGGLARDEATWMAARDVLDTPEKLRAYAERHPAVRHLLRIGCEIVSVVFANRGVESVE